MQKMYLLCIHLIWSFKSDFEFMLILPSQTLQYMKVAVTVRVYVSASLYSQKICTPNLLLIFISEL